MGEQRIETLPIRFMAVATDVNRKKEIWFQQGDLLKAIRASIAIPSFFTPVQMGDMLLVDGGALNPLPVAPTMADRTEKIIAVNLYADVPKTKLQISEDDILRQESIEKRFQDIFNKFFKSDKESVTMYNVLDKTFDTMQEALTHYRLGGYPPDIVIDLPMNLCNSFDFHKAKEVIEAGRVAALKRLEEG